MNSSTTYRVTDRRRNTPADWTKRRPRRRPVCKMHYPCICLYNLSRFAEIGSERIHTHNPELLSAVRHLSARGQCGHIADHHGAAVNIDQTFAFQGLEALVNRLSGHAQQLCDIGL